MRGRGRGGGCVREWECWLDRDRGLDDAGKFGNALSFNGTSARVTVADSPSLRLTSGMTLEAWVFPTTVSSAWRDVIYKGPTTTTT